MIQQFVSMNGYGLYVWLSFGLVTLACAFLYVKTKRTLKKYEKEFLTELRTLSEKEQKAVMEKSKIVSQIYLSSSKTN
jgi:heme exporter protein CcmD|tara:strand:- start:33 stop:266 length:234 start_codon:yes stop_codon:yes gene_type:complete